MGDKIPVSAQDSTAQLLAPLDLGSRPNGELEVQRRRPAARHHRRHPRWRRCSSLERCLLLLVTSLLLGCAALLLYLSGVLRQAETQGVAADPPPCLTQTCLRVASRLLDRMDPSADPCQDFYQYACGSYLRSHVPASDAFFSSNIQHMKDQILVEIKKLIEDNQVARDIPAVKKVETLYNSCVNISSDPAEDLRTSRRAASAVLEELGGWPLLQPDWSEGNFNLTTLITRLHSYQVNTVLEIYVYSDSRDTSTYIIRLFQASPLVSEDILLNQTDPHARRQLEAYRALLADTIAVLGDPHEEQEQQMKEVIQFEIDFAKLRQKTVCESASISELLNNTSSDEQLAEDGRLSPRELSELTEHFDWSAMLETLLSNNNISHTMHIVNVDCKPFVHAVSSFILSNPKRVVANYLVWRFVFKNMRFIGNRLHKIWQDFRKQVPNFYEERVYSSRWKGCAELVEKGMGNVLSYMYIQHYDKHGIKEKMEEMIEYVKNSFRDHILSLKWVDNEMKDALVQKLDRMGQKVAYPDTVLNLTALNEATHDVRFRTLLRDRQLHIDDRHLLYNVLRLRQHEVVRDLRKLLRPVDKNRDWIVRPLQVNAFHYPMTNEILFPLGFLREPFFGLDYPSIANFANMGVVIGHELTHGFDNNGRRHNWGGNVTNWWSDKLLRDFTQRAMCVVNQYSKYKLEVVGKNVDGNKTVGENMCDSSGLKQAFEAWRRWRDARPPEPRLPGVALSDDKLFYVFYGQIWCEVVSREGWEKHAVDVHSPGRYRVQGVLENSPLFAKTFGCPVGSPMNPKKKCHVWN